MLLAAAAIAAPPSRVAYTVAVADIPGKTYRVTVRAEGVTGPAVSFAIPAWTPGWYVLTDAYKYLENASATGTDGAALAVAKTDPLTWRVQTNGAKTVTFAYDLRATDTGYGFFKPYLDDRHGFVPGPAALVYVVDGKTASCAITYKVPANWKVASANAPTGGDPTTFTAPDYDTLIDQPADLGVFRRYDRMISGVPFSVVIVGAENQDVARWVENVFKISEAGIKVFGTTPFPRYIYHFRFPRSGGLGGGAGLEHLNSTVISLPPASLRVPESLSIVAHEFVHAWNVKRIRPEKLGPFDYTKEVRVKDLWFSEGVTEYYAPRLLVEAGLQGRPFWFGYFTENIRELQNNPARWQVTLEAASLGAWEGQSQGFGGLSYYNKGMLVGLLLDIEMRRRTANRVGLDDLMKDLMRQTEKSGKGQAEGEIERTASRLVGGADLRPFFDRALRSTNELPFAETLRAAGLDYRETVTTLPFLGIEWDFGSSRPDTLAVETVVAGGPAEAAGLQAGDRVSAVNNKSVTVLFGAFFQQTKPGDSVTLTVLRGNESPKQMAVTVGKREEVSYRLRPLPSRTPAQEAILARITGTGIAAKDEAAP